MMNKQVFSSSIRTELGYMRALCSSDGLFRLVWQQHAFEMPDKLESSVSHETVKQLSLYFTGALKCFTVPLDLSAHSRAFQRWLKVLVKIPYGQTITYAEYAEQWGNRKAARAAGNACQRNCLPIIIPCHRVVQNRGRFDKYSGGDTRPSTEPNNIARKRWLIEMEEQHS